MRWHGAPIIGPPNGSLALEIVDLYQRVGSLGRNDRRAELDSRGYVPWWDETVPLFNVMVHCLSDATRHVGHADILREEIDGAVGFEPGAPEKHGKDAAFWENRRSIIYSAARAAAATETE